MLTNRSDYRQTADTAASLNNAQIKSWLCPHCVWEVELFNHTQACQHSSYTSRELSYFNFIIRKLMLQRYISFPIKHSYLFSCVLTKWAKYFDIHLALLGSTYTGRGLDIAFIDHLQVVTTNIYNTIADFHILQITTHEVSSSLQCLHWTFLGNGL
jgi:hypothetical protein